MAVASPYGVEQVVDIRRALGRKFVPTDVNHALTLAALNWLANYAGTFDWVLQRRTILARTGSLNNADIAGILNSICFDAEQASRKARYDASQSPPSTEQPGQPARVRLRIKADGACVPAESPVLDLSVIPANLPFQPNVFRNLQPSVPSGTYTVKFLDGSYATVRLADATAVEQEKFRLSPDGQFVGYLMGPNNSSDFINIGTFDRGTLRVWSKHVGKARQIHALNALLSAPQDERHRYGVEYARASGNCYRCGRRLSTPESLERGCGPVCWENS